MNIAVIIKIESKSGKSMNMSVIKPPGFFNRYPRINENRYKNEKIPKYRTISKNPTQGHKCPVYTNLLSW